MPFLSPAGPEKKVLRAAHELMRHHRWDEAIPLYQQATELAPENRDCWIWLGYALQKTERFPDSIEAYRRALDLDKDGLRRGARSLYVSLVNMCIAAGNLDEATAIAGRLVKQAPNHPDTWHCQGLVHVKRRLYAEAERDFQHALDLTPYNLATMRELAALYIYDIRDYIQALELIEEMLIKWPLDPLTWHQKGEALVRYRKLQEAVGAFHRSLAISSARDHDELGNRSYVGLCLVLLGKFGEALAMFDQGETSPRGRSAAFNGRGVIQSRIGRYEAALAWYEAALRVQFSSVVQSNKVEMLATLGRLNEAEAGLGELLANDPDSDGSWLARSVVATVRERYDEALKAFNHALAIYPRSASIHKDFARLLLTLGDADHARAVAERARSLDPYDAGAWEVLAQTLRAAGRTEEADAAEKQGAALLAEQTAEVDAWLRAREARGEPLGPA